MKLNPSQYYNTVSQTSPEESKTRNTIHRIIINFLVSICKKKNIYIYINTNKTFLYLFGLFIGILVNSAKKLCVERRKEEPDGNWFWMWKLSWAVQETIQKLSSKDTLIFVNATFDLDEFNRSLNQLCSEILSRYCKTVLFNW